MNRQQDRSTQLNPWRGLLLTGLVGCLVVAWAYSLPALPDFEPGAAFTGGWSSNETDDVRSVAFGDIDGDGDLDFVAGNDNPLAPSVRVYRNYGTGDFAFVWSSGDENRAVQNVALGDMDNDGDLDFALANYDHVNQVYANDGTGSFTLVWETTGDARSTESVAWGDMDADGDLDLLFGNEWQKNQLFANEGDHVFVNVWESPDELRTKDIALGDVDGDNDLDLAVGNWEEINQVYRNDGALNLSLLWESTGDTKFTRSLAWGDMNGNGRLDLIVANDATAGNDSTQVNQIYENQNGVTFSLAWESTGEALQTRQVAVGDIDEDGDLDMVFGNFDEQNQVYRNDGGFNFALDWDSGTDTNRTRSIQVADIDLDGDLDVAIGNRNQPIQTYRNDGGRNLYLSWDSGGEIQNTRMVIWGDVDNDGDLDLAVGNQDQPNQIYRNNGDGEFAVWWESTGSALDTRNLALGDMDGDGDLDLAVANQAQVNKVYRNQGDGTFTLHWQTTGETKETWDVAWGDADGDGDLDLAFSNPGDVNQVYQNDGSGHFVLGWDSGSDVSNSQGVAWGDADNDGDLDLFIGNQNQPNQVYANDGAGQFVLLWQASETANNTRSIAVADVNSDGWLDFAVANIDEINQVYVNNQDGTFSIAWESTGEQKPTRQISIGDVNGDGHEDLVFANHEEGFQIFQNDVSGAFMLSWESIRPSLNNRSVNLADADSDGDLDLAVGNYSGAVELFENHVFGQAGLPDTRSIVHLIRPDNTAGADLFMTADIIKGSPIAIQYQLADLESDPVREVRVYFSRNLGGAWQRATPASGTSTTNLTTSPSGTMHTFYWDAATDLIKSDSVVLRIEAHQSFHNPGSYLSTYTTSETFPLRVEAADWFVRVLDNDNQSVIGALVYVNGHLQTNEDGKALETDLAGLANLPEAGAGKALVALLPVKEQSTSRDAHDGWAYRTYLTNLDFDNSGDPLPFVLSAPGEQQVTVDQQSTLTLFNIVVSVEWDADDTYLQMLSTGFERASAYLYDVTDGQMAFGQVAIYDNGEHWSHADFQISTKNTVRPYAFIGGILSTDVGHAIRVGRFWDGNSGDLGSWDEPFGYRTLIHEFGHYALHLHDEYFVREVNENGVFTGRKQAACTSPMIQTNDKDATNASVMFYHYNASELADDSQWGVNCQRTEQARVNGQSDWATLRDYYEGPGWALETPDSRGGVMAGPDQFPMNLLPFPDITVNNLGINTPPRTLTVLGPKNQPLPRALVALYTTLDQQTVAIDQGVTNEAGELTVYGAQVNDTIQAASIDGAYAGSALVTDNPTIVVQVQQAERISFDRATAVAGESKSPYLSLIPNSDGDSLLFEVRGVAATTQGMGAVVVPAESAGSPQFAPLSFDSQKSAFTGQVSFASVGLGTGNVQLFGNNINPLNSSYNLQYVANSTDEHLSTEDGNLQLFLTSDSLPFGADQYAILAPTGHLPAPLPDGKEALGSAYAVRLSGATTFFIKPALMEMYYHPDVSGEVSDLIIYYWNAATAVWEPVIGEVDIDHQLVSATVTDLGIYVLGATIERQRDLYLPLIITSP